MAQTGFGSNGHAACGTDQLMKDQLRTNRSFQLINDALEQRLLLQRNNLRPSTPLTTRSLPVVVHIIHNNGSENISDSRVLAGIQHLNEAFANIGYYDEGNGVNTNIQFCLAQRAPDGSSTNGITRNVSTYTNMGGPYYSSDDLSVKNINRWDPRCYINIWLVNDIPGTVAGYAYLPAAHGTNVDGILMEATYFGSSNANDVVIIHEMGHYLGLYHTFQSGCTNDDCTIDGDKVCDTPPDNSTIFAACGATVNSCATDTQSGFTTDQNDLVEDYMDYGNWDCMSVFTQGQSDRMNWHIDQVRNSLLQCNSCLPPCPSPVTASFNASQHVADAGTSISFDNTSINAVNYTWFINGVAVANTFNYSQQFVQPGTYTIRLVATGNNSNLCLPGEATDTVRITCAAQASFTPGFNGISTVGQTISFNSTSSNYLALEWQLDNQPSGSGNSYTTTFNTAGIHTIQLNATNAYCTDSFTVYYRVNAGAGTSISFRKRYFLPRPESGLFGSTFASILPDQSILTIGGSQYLGNNISKQSSSGNPLWLKAYNQEGTGNVWTRFFKLLPGVNGSIVALGTAQSALMGPLIMKTDADGNLIWNKYFEEPASVTPTDIIEMADGSFIVTGKYYSSYLVIYKISATGQLLWRKTLAYGDYEYNQHSLATVNGQIYLSCLVRNRFTPYNFDGLLLKIAPADAAILFAKRYDINNNPNWFSKMRSMGDQLLIEGTTGPDYSSNYLKKKMLLITDLDGVPKNAKLVYFPAFGGWQTPDNLFKTASDKILFSLDDSTGLQSHLVQFDAALRFEKGKTFLLNPEYGTNYHSIDEFSNGDILLAQGGGQNTNILERLLPDLSSGSCQHDDFTPLIDTAVVTVTDITSLVNYANNFAQIDTALILSGQDIDITFTEECIPVTQPPCDTSACNIYQLQGPTFICQSADTLFIRLVKSANCTLSAQWTTSGTARHQVLSRTDSLITIKTLSSGTITIKATSTSDCKIVADSMNVTALHAPANIDLGEDKAICSASILQLNAGSGFTTYRWQDGSTDSTLTVYTPGTYFVTATDLCSRQYSDTIVVSHLVAPPFDLGNNKALCANDTLEITAPAGFSNYIWSPEYAISILYGPTVKIHPLKDTIYTVTAVKDAGCIVLDSIRITVHYPDTIRLGNDTSFCFGKQLLLDAGNNFVQYQWSNGSTTQTIVAASAGQYTVAAVDLNGCEAKDSMRIVAIYPAPVVNLGIDQPICENERIILTPANSFVNYQWQNNAASPSITVNSTGIYWVIVQDANRCIGTDSIAITNILPKPVINLGADTSICEGQYLTLTPGAGYSNYTWQDGTHAANFEAGMQGTYWVEVSNANGCTAIDTVSIISIYPTPALTLGADTVSCNGATITLNAGAGFSEYRWQDQSTSQYFNAANAGLYWVIATTDKGCIATDSLRIQRIVELPKNFISTIIKVCTDDQTIIRTLSPFLSYEWYNGTNADGVLITAPGNYWVKVTDSFGCTARENFEVIVEACSNALYFPNAFSPASNSSNRIFKPTLFGKIEQYRLEIYNRYGQKLFETRDVANGWNGWYKNVQQPLGGYVWICTYQLAGQLPQLRKGTLLLIR